MGTPGIDLPSTACMVGNLILFYFLLWWALFPVMPRLSMRSWEGAEHHTCQSMPRLPALLCDKVLSTPSVTTPSDYFYLISKDKTAPELWCECEVSRSITFMSVVTCHSYDVDCGDSVASGFALLGRISGSPPGLEALGVLLSKLCGCFKVRETRRWC